MEYPTEGQIDTTNLDDYAKLVANSISGGLYDLGHHIWSGNPLNYLYDIDAPGIGEWATGVNPFTHEGEGALFDYDPGAKTFGADPKKSEEWGRLAATLGIPIGGIPLAALKFPKMIEAGSKVLPSLQWFADTAKLNRLNRLWKEAYKIAEKAEGKGKVTMESLNKASKLLKKPGKWSTFMDYFVKPYGQTFTRPFNPIHWARKGTKHPTKFKPTDIVPKKVRSRVPEANYLKQAGRNWAVASALRGGKEGIMEVMKDDNPIFQAVASEYTPPYEDRIMRMARTKDPGLEVTVPLPYQE